PRGVDTGGVPPLARDHSTARSLVMTEAFRLLAITAHPDDETLGFGGTLARYAREGVEVSLMTATRGERGRYRGHPAGSPEHPGPAALGAIREQELHAAADVLGIRQVRLLGYDDQRVDQTDVMSATATIAEGLRAIRPQVVVTFAADGAYGHPDHIAISQL